MIIFFTAFCWFVEAEQREQPVDESLVVQLLLLPGEERRRASAASVPDAHPVQQDLSLAPVQKSSRVKNIFHHLHFFKYPN